MLALMTVGSLAFIGAALAERSSLRNVDSPA
jgi:hypothetical protein